MDDPRKVSTRADALNEYLNENLGLNYLKQKKGELLAGADDAIQKHIVNPISEAGYPNVGAGIGAGLSTVAQTGADLVPTSTTDVALSAVPLPGIKTLGTASKVFAPEVRQALMKKLEEKFASNPEHIPGAMQQLEHSAMNRAGGSGLEATAEVSRAGKAQDAKNMLAPEAPPVPAVKAPTTPDVAGPSDNWIDAFDSKKKPRLP